MNPIKFILLIALLLSAGSLNAQRKKKLKEIKGTKKPLLWKLSPQDIMQYTKIRIIS